MIASSIFKFLLQNVTFGDRNFQLSIIAQPEFITSRRTQNPEFVLGFSLSIVFVLVILFALLGAYLHWREMQRGKEEAEKRKQHALLITAAKEAHEKTIAYACHQLRCALVLLGCSWFL